MSRGNIYSVPRDANRVPFLVAASTADGVTPVVLEADPTTHQLQVSSSGGGTQYAEGATTSPATGNVALGRYLSSTPSLSSNQLESLQLDSSGNLKVKLSGDTTATGTITGSSQSVTIATNGQSSVGIQVSGTFSGTILIKGSVDGTSYTPTSAVALSNGAISTTITSSYTGQANAGGLVSFQLTAITWASGNASVTLVASVANSTVMLDNPLPIGTNSIGNVGLNAGSNAIGSISSTNATGSAVPTGAYYQGGLAQTTLPTAATAGNLTGMMVDKYGRQIVVTNTIRDLTTSQTTTISTTTETTIATATASVFNDITAIWVNNTSASAVRVDFRDTTAGSILFQLYIPAGDVRGFTFNTPYAQTSVNTNWTAQCSAALTDIRITTLYIKNK